MKVLEELQPSSCQRGRVTNSELWHACAGPLVTLPEPGGLVYYFPQGHSEQVIASTRQKADSHIPSYSGLPSQMMCQVHHITLHADKETDEIYAQITLQPVNSEDDVHPAPDFGQWKSKQPVEFFCKTLTASDTSTHGGFSVPRRAAEKLFPTLDYSSQSPNQELVVRDLHDNSWTFRHIYRGQPKRHLLTTGWSVFVGAKRLKAGDSVLFIRGESSQLMMGVKRANRQHAMLTSSVLSTDSMHFGVLAAAAQAASNRSQFTVFYNPRACPSQFVVPLTKYHKATYGTQVSIGMRFGMMFETEDSNMRRYMGTITGISDSDQLNWPNSKWRNLQVEWDENGCVGRPDRVSLWEIEISDNRFSFPSPAPYFKRPCSEAVVDMGHMTKKPFLENAGNRSGSNICPIRSSTDSMDLVETTPESKCLITIAQFGCQQSMYSSVSHNLIKDEFPMTSSVTPECILVGSQARQETICQSEELQHSRSLCLQQNQYPLQNLVRDQYGIPCTNKHRLASVELDSRLLASQGGISEASSSASAVTEQCQNDTFEKKNDTSSSKNVWEEDSDGALERLVTTSNQLKIFSQVTVPLEKHSEESLIMTDRLNTDDGPSFTNQCTPLMFEEKFQLVGSQRHEADIIQPEEHDMPPTNTTELNCFPSPKGQYSNTIMDVLGWMLPPAGKSDMQLPQSHHSLSTHSKEDSALLQGSEYAACSADISAVVNQVGSTHVQNDQENTLSPPAMVQDLLSTQLPNCPGNMAQLGEQTPYYLEQHTLGVPPSIMYNVSATTFQDFSNYYALKNFGENKIPNDYCSSLCLENYSESTLIDPSVSSTSQGGFGTAQISGLTFPSNGMAYDFNACQDTQSQITTPSFSLQDSFGNASSNSIDLCSKRLVCKGSWKQLSSRRTYTKVQKLGSVGRSIDVTRFGNYDDLKSAIASMFGLERQLDDPRGLGWKLVYMDYENDVLLVGDDPWEEFVRCVRCIKILSPSEVQQMIRKDMDPTDDANTNQMAHPFLKEAIEFN